MLLTMGKQDCARDKSDHPSCIHMSSEPFCSLTWSAAFHGHTPVLSGSRANARVLWHHPKDALPNSAISASEALYTGLNWEDPADRTVSGIFPPDPQRLVKAIYPRLVSSP